MGWHHSKEHYMSKNIDWDAIREKALADKAADAPPPPTPPTQAEQNWYDENRKT
jgi:hypothetical protein